MRRYRKVYGKRQGKYPGRWLTYEEAFHRLIPATRDGTDAGLRDELVIRLGLLGMRQAEIAALNWTALVALPSILWNGKGSVPRRATAGGALVRHLGSYRMRYETVHGPIGPGLPVVCRAVSGPPRLDGSRPLHWGQRLNSRNGVFTIVTSAAERAGLGHVAPHDLRRSAAGILHRAVSADGAHHFDLLDIQQVLGHADPATTMKSYLEPIDTAVLDKAGAVLD